jgi:polyisoprenoid-binding protein YceI
MAMKIAISLISLVATLAAAAPAARAIDPVHSHAQFSVSHIWVERVTGTVPIVSGSVTLADGSVIPTEVTAVLDATRLVTEEPDRDRALKSPDFFDTDKFPQWTFASTKVVPGSARAFEVDGNLTIHGVTRPERLNVTVGGTAANPVYHATTQLDRHAFGMAVTRLDPTIGSTVDVTLDVALR